MTPTILQDDPSIKSFFDIVWIKSLALLEHLSFEFLKGLMCSPCLVGQAAARGLLELTHCIGSTDVQSITSKAHNPFQ